MDIVVLAAFMAQETLDALRLLLHKRGRMSTVWFIVFDRCFVLDQL
jgi:hypothetical protein